LSIPKRISLNYVISDQLKKSRLENQILPTSAPGTTELRNWSSELRIMVLRSICGQQVIPQGVAQVFRLCHSGDDSWVTYFPREFFS